MLNFWKRLFANEGGFTDKSPVEPAPPKEPPVKIGFERAREKYHEYLMHQYGGIQKCPWCKQFAQEGDGWKFEQGEKVIGVFGEVLTCGVCGGTSLWEFHLGMIYIRPLEAPVPDGFKRVIKSYAEVVYEPITVEAAGGEFEPMEDDPKGAWLGMGDDADDTKPGEWLDPEQREDFDPVYETYGEVKKPVEEEKDTPEARRAAGLHPEDMDDPW